MLHTIKNEFLSVSASAKGAQLQSVLGADGTQYLWQGNPKYWSDRALNIFPYVARLTRGGYLLDGKWYEMAIHGLAPYGEFSLAANDGQTMVLELADSAETRRQYPRHFVFRVIYALKGKTLEITYQVENRDQRTMYFGLGGHPGFCVPLVSGKRFEDYRLRFTEPCQPRRVCFNEACFVTGEQRPYPLTGDDTIRLRHDLFDDDAIVLTGMTRQVTLETEGDPHGVTVTFPGMEYLGLWHWPKTDAPYICIEPWCSLPATADKTVVLEEQKDLIALEPGGVYENRWSIQIHDGT